VSETKISTDVDADVAVDDERQVDVSPERPEETTRKLARGKKAVFGPSPRVKAKALLG
jgi:hypothetical protein